MSKDNFCAIPEKELFYYLLTFAMWQYFRGTSVIKEKEIFIEIDCKHIFVHSYKIVYPLQLICWSVGA